MFRLSKETFVQDITKDGTFSRIPNRYRRKDPNIQKYKLKNNQDPEFISTVYPNNSLYDTDELQKIRNSLEQKEWVIKEGDTYDMYTTTPKEEIKEVYRGICFYIDQFFSMFGL